MIVNFIAPAWGDEDSPEARQAGLELYASSVDGLVVVHDPVFGSDVVRIEGRVDELPLNLKGVTVRRVRIVRTNMPVTDATDGPYKDDGITAYVETEYADGELQQTVTVTGPDIKSAVAWFDKLLAGKKHAKNAYRVKYTETTPLN